jgi:outer membrane protein
MKNLQTVLNVLVVAAVGVLFYLHFSKKSSVGIAKAGNDKNNAANNFKIAYFEMDSVESQYLYLKDVRNNLRALEQKKGDELNALRRAGKAKLQEYQSKGKSMTQEEMAAANEVLMKMDNELRAQEQIKSQELQDESIRKIQEVKKTIEDYLKAYNKNHNYAYIISSSSDILYYKDTIYDITKEIIKGLNEEYKNKKKN